MSYFSPSQASYFSPSRKKSPHRIKAEPVFKTPMTFSPRMTGTKARPSPSRIDLWKEELGIEDEPDSGGSGEMSNSDDETEVDQNTFKLASCSLIEYQALERELEERNQQRDDLLFRIKTLNDKNKVYCQRVKREEVNKKQQLKIIRLTHEAHLSEKQMLITNLEAIVDEQEARIFHQEAMLKGEPVEDLDRKPFGIVQLVKQMETLQTEKIDLLQQVELARAEVERLHTTGSDVSEEYQDRFDSLEKENSKLQEEVIRLRNIKSTGSTDSEKQLYKLEVENDRQTRELMEEQFLRQQLTQEFAGRESSNKHTIKKLKEENDSLVQKINSRDSDSRELERSEHSLREKVKRLEKENQESDRKARELSARLSLHLAKSPEVVTRVQRVEVESPGTKELLSNVEEENDRLKIENSSLQEQIKTAASKLEGQYEVKINELEKLTKDRDDLQTKLKSLEGKYENTETEKSDTVEKLAALESRCRESEQLNREQAEKILTLQTRCKETESHLVVAERKTMEVEKQLSQYEDQMVLIHEQLNAEIEELRASKVKELERLRRESAERQHNLEMTLSAVQGRLHVLEPSMSALVADYRVLRKQCHAMPTLIRKEVEVTTKQLVKAIADMSQYNHELIRKYRKEMALRKKYHNELVELKGNIRVFARVRPAIREDGSGPQAKVVVSIDPDDDGIINVMYKTRQQTFEVDRAFDPSVSQEEVFSQVQALVTSCIDGYNICIFAYGQTGSGKTYTMEGTADDPGINQRALQELFRETEERSAEWRYVMSVSVIEIYNEMIRDLLGSDPNQRLEVKMNPEGGVHVPGLVSYEVGCVQDVNQVFMLGRKNRQTASTNMNEHSSRSHALLCVHVLGTNITTGAKAMGKLNLVDLAGSERVSKSGADGDRLKETQSINKSLSCLGDVIHALRSKQSHIPYRNSRLTYLLQDSLGGDSKTLMIVQVAPVEKNCGETVASLGFAARVRSVELGQATKRLENSDGTNGDTSNGLTNGRTQVKVNTPVKTNNTPNSKLPLTRRK